MELRCFDVSPSGDLVATGTAAGVAHLWARSSAGAGARVSAAAPAEALPYPDTFDRGQIVEMDGRFSDELGPPDHWGRTRPVLGRTLLGHEPPTSGDLPVFLPNEKGIPPNTVHILPAAAAAKSAADSFGAPLIAAARCSPAGLAVLDGEGPAAHWNQIVRLLRQSAAVCDIVISHANAGCERDPCVACELALLFRTPASAPLTAPAQARSVFRPGVPSTRTTSSRPSDRTRSSRRCRATRAFGRGLAGVCV